MTTKKKKKTAMNAIDKYLLQKRYSQGKKSDENQKPEIKVLKVVVPKIKTLKITSNNALKKRRSGRSAQTKVFVSEDVKVDEKDQKFKSVDENVILKKAQNHVPKPRKIVSSKSSISNNQLDAKMTVKCGKNEERRRGRKPKLRNQRRTISEMKKLMKKDSIAHTDVNKPYVPSDEVSDNANSFDDHPIVDSNAAEYTAFEDSYSSSRKSAKSTECCLPKKKRQVVSFQLETGKEPEPANQAYCSVIEVPNNINNKSADKDVVEEITPITKKYQPYMERLKSLTSDAIKKYIKDNQQYYIDFKKEVESKTTNISTLNKKMKKHDEMRDSFKCNPFSSDQQLAMYYTLREVFNVPNSYFKECRNFFTVLIPEISCQLFAETFHCSVSGAPRLIKKLYPNPICPI